MKTLYSLFLAVSLAWFAPACLAALPTDPSPENEGIGINQTDVLVYPFEMTNSGVLAGEVRVVVSVDVNGKLSDALVVGYTNVRFAEAAVSALKRWSFTPALVNGQPLASRANVLFIFKNTTGVTVERLSGLAYSSLAQSKNDHYAYLACQLRDLDRIPIPVRVVPPVSSKSGLRGARHTVTVEFYIDEEGHVRIPAIGRDEANDAYAAAAVSAVEQWQFEPPLRKGRPVLVLAKQDFTFVPKP